jgi:hypothetical protein
VQQIQLQRSRFTGQRLVQRRRQPVAIRLGEQILNLQALKRLLKPARQALDAAIGEGDRAVRVVDQQAVAHGIEQRLAEGPLAGRLGLALLEPLQQGEVLHHHCRLPGDRRHDLLPARRLDIARRTRADE